MAKRPEAKRIGQKPNHHDAERGYAIECGRHAYQQGENAEHGEECAHNKRKNMAGEIIAVRIFRREQVEFRKRPTAVIYSKESPNFHGLPGGGFRQVYIVVSATDELPARSEIVAEGINLFAARKHVEGHMHRTHPERHGGCGIFRQVKLQHEGIAKPRVLRRLKLRYGGHQNRIALIEGHRANIQALNRRGKTIPAHRQERSQGTDQKADGQYPSEDYFHLVLHRCNKNNTFLGRNNKKFTLSKRKSPFFDKKIGHSTWLRSNFVFCALESMAAAHLCTTDRAAPNCRELIPPAGARLGLSPTLN